MLLETSTIRANGVFEFCYDVVISQNIFDTENEILAQYLENTCFLVVISEMIEKLYYDKIYTYFSKKNGKDMFKIITIKTSEVNKEIDNVCKILEEAKKFGLGRKSILVGIGGGVLLDMVGFAASMFRRGIRYLRVPTTLVGQIDAGIGIKTGANFLGSKNYIGSFYPPMAAVNDIELLKTLPLHHLQNGLSEIIKMAIIVDAQLFTMVKEHFPRFLRKQCLGAETLEISHRAIATMLDELRVNFYERNLERLVDFGHTFSPFIETYSEYKINHGFAVAMDMAISTEISCLLGVIEREDRDRILNLLTSVGLDVYDSETYKADRMWASLKDIVLHRGGNLNLVIPTQIGRADFVRNLNTISPALLQQALLNLENFHHENSSNFSYANVESKLHC